MIKAIHLVFKIFYNFDNLILNFETLFFCPLLNPFPRQLIIITSWVKYLLDFLWRHGLEFISVPWIISVFSGIRYFGCSFKSLSLVRNNFLSYLEMSVGHSYPWVLNTISRHGSLRVAYLTFQEVTAKR